MTNPEKSLSSMYEVWSIPSYSMNEGISANVGTPTNDSAFFFQSLFENHFKLLYPEIYLIITVTLILLFGVLYNASAYYKYPIMTSSVSWLSLQTLVITMILTISGKENIGKEDFYDYIEWGSSNGNLSSTAMGTIEDFGSNSVVLFNNVLISDNFTTLIKIILLFSAFSTIVISLSFIKRQKINSFEYIVLIMYSTLSMFFIVSSYDLISMYLAIELQSLCFYVLAAFQRNNEFSTEAGLKYFILGALSSGLLLYGASIVYGFTGITNFEELSKLNLNISTDILYDFAGSSLGGGSNNTLNMDVHSSLPSISPFVSLGLFFMLVAFLFKIAAVPFHMWTPDVYEGAPTSVTAFFAITPKIAIITLLLRMCLDTFWDLIDSWRTIIIICSILSMFVGTLGALNQNKIKRLFAYSSIAHVGYMLIGLSTGTIEGMESLLIYIIIYIIMIINVFGILLSISHAKESTHIDPNSLGIADSSLSRSPSGGSSRILGGLLPSSSDLGHIRFSTTSVGTSSSWSETETSLLKSSYPLWSPFFVSSQRKEQSHSSSLSAGAGDQLHSWKFPVHQSLDNLTRIRKSPSYIKYISDLVGLSRSNPLLAATAAIIFFSNAGVPPLAGFYGKLNVFLSAMESSLYVLAISAILCSVMGAFYSIRLIKIMYFQKVPSSFLWTHYQQIPKASSFLLANTLFFTLFFFLYPSFLFVLTHAACLDLA